MINDAMFSSNTNEWATPQAFFDELNKNLNFTLDPCATPQNAKYARYFTKEIDGLAQSWRGEVVFCNPPYGRDISKWVAKAYSRNPYRGGKTCCFAYTRPNGYGVLPRLYIQKARNTFRPRTLTLQRSKCGAPFPSMVVVMRGRNDD